MFTVILIVASVSLGWFGYSGGRTAVELWTIHHKADYFLISVAIWFCSMAMAGIYAAIDRIARAEWFDEEG